MITDDEPSCLNSRVAPRQRRPKVPKSHADIALLLQLALSVIIMMIVAQQVGQGCLDGEAPPRSFVLKPIAMAMPTH